MIAIAFLPLILGTGLMLLVIAVGLLLVGVAVGSVLGTLLHILAAMAFAAVAWYWVVPTLAKRGFNVPKAQTTTFYLSLAIAAALLFLAIPGNGLFAISSALPLGSVAASMGATDLTGYALFWGALLFGGGFILKKLRVIK